ncbi:glutathione S-transferase omega-1-like isoform X2 [Gopherus evgoodei]|uniref:glutathione S-transferase omega-1-like isoform X2 n=1 Tax=Gopherus evgoodei TaxID=1825980 RepID=UPI0011CF3A1F|nr:glutathione S-transferase omega-1-like isoform X2 [Gopherus evgoodei]
MAGERARSLGKGSTAPGPVPEGLIRVYSMRFCPFAERTLLVLKSKGIKHEIININLKNKPDWLFEKNPFGLVPILETSKGQLIYESPITCEYLDEAYPGKKLLPADPYERAYQKMLLERFSKILAGCKTVFYGGDSVSMIDYMIWPWFERLEFFQLPDCLQHTPKLRQWVEAMKKDPAVKATMTDTQMLKGFFELYAKNSPEACDYGL